LGTLGAQTLIYNPNDWLTNTDKYDSNGNTTNSAGNNYQYDALNHVTNVSNSGILLTYDGDGNRISKTVSGATTYYLLDDRNPSGYAQVLEEWTSGGGTPNLSKVYSYGLALISQRQPGASTNFFGADGHGSTRFLLDAAGHFANVFAYDAYGILIASNAPAQTTHLYCGEQLDPDVGFYYLRARYLAPGIGRFWTADPLEGNVEDPLSLHKYQYCQADPVNGRDPSGHAEDVDVGDIFASFDGFSEPTEYLAASKPAAGTQVTKLIYDITWYSPRGKSVAGCEIKLGATVPEPNRSKIGEYRWVQRIKADPPLNGQSKDWHFDSTGNDPYYYTDAEEAANRNTEGYTSIFYDSPQRYTSWREADFDAQTWFVLTRATGSKDYAKLVKITWGFQMISGKPYLKPLKIRPYDYFNNDDQ